MKKPFSIILITRDKKTDNEIHIKYETETAHPRIEIIKFLLKSIFKIDLGK